MATRGEYQIGANLTGLGTDDPDANFYEKLRVRIAPQLQPVLQRGRMMKLFDRQSQELDVKKRLEMVVAKSRNGSRRTRPGPSWPSVSTIFATGPT